MVTSGCMLPTYDELTADQIKMINENSYLVKHKKGEQIFRQEQPVSHVMLIRSGLVKLYKEIDSAKLMILKIAGPGSYVGIISAFYVSRYQDSATALEETEIIYASLPVIKEIIGANGKYALHMLNQLSTEGISLVDKMINLSQKQIPGRIAGILLFFSREVYQSNDRLIEIIDRKVVLKSNDLLEILSRMG
jgi:CRP/FNR family transcriptional regulator